jgi:predicted outer membrane repeat protein
MKKLFGFLFLAALLPATAVANIYVPNTFTDPVITSLNNANGQINGGATISLRSALMAADNLGGTHTVTLSTGTYALTQALPNRQITIGNTAQNITINGNGPANTIISMTADANKDRILLINPVGTVINVFTTFSGVKFANGYLTADTYGGAAIYAGGIGAQGLTITNCLFDNNIAPSAAGSGGIGGAINMFQGTLNVSDSTFTNNKSMDGDGGAIYYSLYNLNATDSGVINITRSTFSANTAKQNGGAISFTAQGALKAGQTFSVTINKNTFLANAAAGYGGAVAANNSAAVSIPAINFNRFAGNTSTASATTSGLLFVNSAGSVNAANNWWGCNAGPSTSGCNQASGVGTPGAGSLTLTPWLQLRNSASPATVIVGGTTTVSADIFGLNTGGATASGNLTGLAAFPASGTVFANVQRGTIPGGTIQFVSGAVTVVFTGTTGGVGGVDATADSQTVTAPITVNVPPSITCPADITTNAAGYCVPSIAFASTVTAGIPAPVVSYKLGASVITSPYTFPIGTNTVTSTATNVAGTNICAFKVTVAAGAAPQLSILRSSTNVVVSWTNSFPCYALQYAPVLASNSWSAYPGPFATNSGKIFVTNTAPFTNRFFRLKF